MAKKDVIVDFHDPKDASAPPKAVSQGNESEKEGAPEESAQSENTEKAVEKKKD